VGKEGKKSKRIFSRNLPRLGGKTGSERKREEKDSETLRRKSSLVRFLGKENARLGIQERENRFCGEKEGEANAWKRTGTLSQ